LKKRKKMFDTKLKNLEKQLKDGEEKENKLSERENNITNVEKDKKKEQLEKDEFIINQEEYDIQLRELREDCNKLEQENLKYIMQLRKKEEDIEVHLNLKVELQNEISDLNENIKALEETMHKLAQKKKPLISFVRNNEHELENTKLELQKLNGENLALQQTIKKFK